MFASVDLTALLPLLNSIVDALGNIDGWVAGLGALVLLVVQRAGGAKFDLWGTVKAVLSKFSTKAPAVDPLGIPADLDAHELEVLKVVVDQIKAARGEAVQAVVTAQRDGLFKRIFGDKPTV